MFVLSATMADQRADDGQPLVSSTTSTTTTSGPHSTTTTNTSAGPGATVTTHGPDSITITHPTITTTTQIPQSPTQQPQTQTDISPAQPSQPQLQPQTPQPQVPAPTAAPITRTRTGSIRIRRPSTGRDIPVAQPAPAAHPLQSIPQAQPAPIIPRPAPVTDNSWQGQGNRRRSSSEPNRPSLAVLDAAHEHELRHHPTATTPLAPLYEDASRTGTNVGAGPPPTQGGSKRRPGMNKMSSAINLRRRDHQRKDHEIDNDMVDMLDVIGRWIWLYGELHLTVNRS